jgi:hypothetical protein
MSRTFRRLTAVLILALLTGAGAAQALPMTKANGPGASRFENPLLRAWNWVVAIVEKHTTFIDPNGNSLIADPGDPTETGTGVTAAGSINQNGEQ